MVVSEQVMTRMMKTRNRNPYLEEETLDAQSMADLWAPFSSHVVDLRGPDGVEDEEELYEDASEGEDSPHDDPRTRLGVHALVRDLTGDLVRPHWVLQSPLPARDQTVATISHRNISS